MEVEEEHIEQRLWRRIKTKCKFMRPIFKIIPFDQDSILYNRPDDRTIHLISHELEQISKFTFDAKPQSLCLSPDKQTLYVGCHDGKLTRLNIADRTPTTKQHLQQSQTFINDILLIPNSSTSVNCYNNGILRFWNSQTLQIKHSIKVHSTYTYKLRTRGLNLFSCSHDSKVVITDLETSDQVRSLVHGGSVWGIHCCGESELASVGLFGAGCIWDVRIGRRVQMWQLPGHESSFVTDSDMPLELVMGDTQTVKSFDRRAGKVYIKTTSLLSTEAILMLKNKKAVMAGRGGEIATFSTQVIDDTAFVPPPPALLLLEDHNGGPAIQLGVVANPGDQEDEPDQEPDYEDDHLQNDDQAQQLGDFEIDDQQDYLQMEDIDEDGDDDN